jgi:hypothetical protein
MSSFYLVTYRPMAYTRRGREAAREFNIPLFADGSCRREPDLERDYPSITTLCRGERFAPRLERGDRVAYIAKKAWYEGVDEAHWRLAAILSVSQLNASPRVGTGFPH